MYILGIESSCDDTCAAVVKDGRELLSNCVASSAAEQNLYGGVCRRLQAAATSSISLRWRGPRWTKRARRG
jgi:N6-L-threonylcarbamoyladenine synthase